MRLSEVIKVVSDDEVFRTNFLLFKKISLNYRDISLLDNVAIKFQWVKELYLNHNNLQHLQGIEQFKNLEVLQLKNNNIESIAVLTAIHNKFALKNLNLLNNPVANDPKCTFKYLSATFVNLRELNEALTCFNQSKQLLQEIKNHLDHQPVRQPRKPKLSQDQIPIPPCIQTTAKFASSKTKSVAILKNLDENSQPNVPLQTRNQSQQPVNMTSLNLSGISYGRKSLHTKFVDTSLNFSQIRNSFDQTLAENDVSIFHTRLDHHIQEIDDDLTVLANVFYDRSLKCKVIKSFQTNRQTARLQTNFSLCNFEDTTKVSLVDASNLNFAIEFHSMYQKLKIFTYLKSLVSNKSTRRQVLHRYATKQKQALNSSRDTSKTYRRIEDINMPLSRR